MRASADSLISLSAGSPSKKQPLPTAGVTPQLHALGTLLSGRRQPDPPGVRKSVCPWTLMAKIGISNRSSFVSGAVSGGFVCLKSDFCTTNKKKEPKSKNLIPSSGRGTIGVREFGTETVLFYLLCCAGVPLMRFSMEMSFLTGRRRSHIFDGRLNRFTTKVAHGIVVWGSPLEVEYISRNEHKIVSDKLKTPHNSNNYRFELKLRKCNLIKVQKSLNRCLYLSGIGLSRAEKISAPMLHPFRKYSSAIIKGKLTLNRVNPFAALLSGKHLSLA